MAWTEQCKIAFRANASAKIGQQKKKNISGVLKILSEESGIPFNTLRTWYYEKYKNDAPRIETDTTSSPKNDNTDYSKIICIECGKKPVYLSHGKPSGIESKYHGLCRTCRGKKEAIIYLDRNILPEDGFPAVCPSCGTTHYINKKRIGG